MNIPPFDEKELRIVEEVPGFPGAPAIPVYDFPMPPKEAYASLFKKRAVWQMTALEQKTFCPRVNPDNVARAFVFDGSGMKPFEGGGKDMFGIEWEFVPKAGGSMVRPGKPFLADANEWYGKIAWPDIDSWDWEGAARENERFLNSEKYIVCTFMNGWYERLISFMDFEGAVVAMIDEDQTDAVRALFDRLSDLYVKILGMYQIYFPQIDGYSIHDDWGSQKETFFSPVTAENMIVPYMKKVTDYLHSIGKSCELHSCGQLLKQIPNMINAGWDSWSGQMINDTHKIYELYGDKIIIGVAPDSYDPAAASEEEQRAFARGYADKFCDPKKPSQFNFYGGAALTRAYREELYACSRRNYSAG